MLGMPLTRLLFWNERLVEIANHERQQSEP